MAELIYLKATDYRRCSLADKEKAGHCCLPVYVCLSSQYEFHSLLLLPLSEECTPLSIQYYDSLCLNCFFERGLVVLTLASWLHFP